MAEPVTEAKPKSFLQEHGTSLLCVAAVVALIKYYDLYFGDILIAALGLTFIIFIHELGHFLAAKACDVHVKTFSIGFGPALPFCSHKLGETTYKLALIPLGGFVSMVGQEDGVVDDSADPDPRSYKNKSVPQRMLIISAGVIMNVLLAGACFLGAYLHGVDENPAVVAFLEPGGAAWRAGIHSGSRITQVGSIPNPTFPDLKPVVMSTQKGEKLPVSVTHIGAARDFQIEPVREEGTPFPVLGVAFPSKMQTQFMKRHALPATGEFTTAAAATGSDGTGFRSGDTIVAMSDPADSKRGQTPFSTANLPYFDYRERLVKLAGEPVTFTVKRAGQSGPDADGPEATITVAPQYRRDLGLRMRMGPITAVRTGSSAEAAGVTPKAGALPGDRIVAVELTGADGTTITYTNDETVKPSGQRRPLDPLSLPHELNRWADAKPSVATVKLTVRREVDHKEQSVTLPPIAWDASHRFDEAQPTQPFSPLPLNGLGIAYRVLAIVDAVRPGGPADRVGVKPNDEIKAIRLAGWNAKDKAATFGEWQEIKPEFWANADHVFQNLSPAADDLLLRSIVLRVQRGEAVSEMQIAGVDDPTKPLDDRGLILAPAMEFAKASSVGEALGMGWKRTMRTIRGTYLSLYGLVSGRTSVTQINGPITLARVSYLFAGQDVWQMLVLMGVISVNLAVVNFLPVPVLDGGHMVFLAYEGIRGKPASERVQEILVYVGLACVGSLMLLSISMDLYRIFAG